MCWCTLSVGTNAKLLNALTKSTVYRVGRNPTPTLLLASLCVPLLCIPLCALCVHLDVSLSRPCGPYQFGDHLVTVPVPGFVGQKSPGQRQAGQMEISDHVQQFVRCGL